MVILNISFIFLSINLNYNQIYHIKFSRNCANIFNLKTLLNPIEMCISYVILMMCRKETLL